MSSISSRITEIIAQRKPKTERIPVVKRELDLLLSELSKIVEYYQKDKKNKKKSKIKKEIKHLEQQIFKQKETLDKLQSRFSRDTLTIGIVGRMRQGKSQLIQTITGLTDAEIPTTDGQATTGARSKIHNKDTDSSYGEVVFYTEDEFINDVLKLYYKELSLGRPPASLHEFETLKFPELNDTRSEAQTQYRALKKYHKHLGIYKDFILTNKSKTIPKNEIKFYVSQRDPEDKQQEYYNYLAVKEVKIFTPFPHTDTSQITLIDMPGLGEVTIGDDKRMVNAIAEDVDMILFLRKPEASGDAWKDVDVKLYDTVGSALNKFLPLEKWSFMALNRFDIVAPNNNKSNCEDLQNTVHVFDINVAKTIIVNAKNTNDVNDELLTPLLSYMSDNIAELDKIYYEKVQKEILTLLGNLENIKSEISPRSRSEAAEINLFFEDFWENLAANLGHLVKDLYKDQNKLDTVFEKGIKDAFKNLKKDIIEGKTKEDEIVIIPDLKEIERKMHSRQGGAYQDYLDNIRTQLTAQFRNLDVNFAVPIEQTKQDVIKAIRDAGLDFLPNTTDEFLAIIKELAPAKSVFKEMNQAFVDLFSFQVLFRGFVQHRIQKHLDTLYAGLTPMQLPQNPLPQDIRKRLERARDKTLYDIENELGQMKHEPNAIKLAIVSEFRDRVIFAKRVKDFEWRTFVDENAGKISALSKHLEEQALFEDIKKIIARKDKFIIV